MNLARFASLAFILGSLSTLAHAQQPQPTPYAGAPCALTADHLPALRGFYLGMTAEEASALVSPSVEFPRENELGQMRVTLFAINLPVAERDGVAIVRLQFLDHRLADLQITYDRATRFDSAREFSERLSAALNLPREAWRSSGQHYLLECADFRLITGVTASSNVLRVQRHGSEETIQQRRDELERSGRRVFRP